MLRCFYNRVEFDGTVHPLETLEEFSGSLREYVFPREAMGFGDVKFIAGIGAFLGWKAVFFSIAAASMVGSVVGVLLLVSGPKTRSLKIPFGPYLSVGRFAVDVCWGGDRALVSGVDGRKLTLKDAQKRVHRGCRPARKKGGFR